MRDVSRSTASRFFSGRPTSLGVTLKILEALNLRFDQVAKPIDDADGLVAVSAEQPATK